MAWAACITSPSYRTIKSRSSKVALMVPQVIDQAEQVARDPASLSDLHISTQKWAGHVRQLVDATQQANLPWSRTADKLVTAAKTGEGVRKQVSVCMWVWCVCVWVWCVCVGVCVFRLELLANFTTCRWHT